MPGWVETEKKRWREKLEKIIRGRVVGWEESDDERRCRDKSSKSGDIEIEV